MEDAVDVTFLQSNRPMGNVTEANFYKSGKHKLYSYKTDVSLLSNILKMFSTPYYAGSIADMDIFKAAKYPQVVIEEIV